jgi:hypothetical protein
MERLPLYDIKTDMIYLIFPENIYSRILYQHYRIVTPDFFKEWQKRHPEKKIEINWKTLNEKYYHHFFHSFVDYNMITDCARPSYHPLFTHIKPYFTQDELYYLAYDWEILVNREKTELPALCRLIQEHDIGADTLINHSRYIEKKKAIGLVKHYSLFGSHFINNYYRDPPLTRDAVLETQSDLLYNLIQKAPVFKKEYTVYRFIDRDYFLTNLTIGDTFIDPGFLSTTRNPFHYQEHYHFGYILIKIKLPDKQEGVGLAVEGYSNFAFEEEIVLQAGSILRLDKVIENVDHESLLKNKVIKKYEMTWIGVKPRNLPTGEWEPVNFLTEDHMLKQYGLDWLLNNTGSHLQFRTNIGKEILFTIRSYNSLNAYKPFFSYKTAKGVVIYSSNPRFGNINISIEVGPQLRVNWYFRHSVSDSSDLIDLEKEEWLKWLSLLAYFFLVRDVVIYSNYLTSSHKMGSYSETIYQYLKTGHRKFNIEEITTEFEYYRLDMINKMPLAKLKHDSQTEELFQIADQVNIDTAGKLYIYLADNKPHLIPILEKTVSIEFEVDPFQVSYVLDSWLYLYNRDIIPYLPEKEYTGLESPTKDKIPQFVNRLRYYFEKPLA